MTSGRPPCYAGGVPLPGRVSAIGATALAIASLSCTKARTVADASTASCTTCHGGLDNQTGAPPYDLKGHAETSWPGVGAHTRHVVDGGLACAECHPDPRHGSKTHANGAVDVVFGSFATHGGTLPSRYDAATGCSSVYCHGAFTGGDASNVPVWTKVDGTQAACGTCHGLPPSEPRHPDVDASAGLEACNLCHPATIDATGALIPAASGGKHLDGIVEALGHGEAWMDPSSAGFHAFTAELGLDACKGCHGQDLSGGVAGVACGQCHDQDLPPGVASWRTNCTMCHGGTDNQTGAPPRTTWGRSADPIRTGAHTRHVSNGLDCGVCHVRPADALAAGHIDATTATVTFAGLAVTGGAQPSWSRADASCASTYCHGNFRNGNATYAPSWTAPAANACGTCHTLPPGGTHPKNPTCGNCHDGYTSTSVNPALHLNGAVDVMGLTCSSCHGTSTRQPTAQNPQLAAAPPMDTLGNVDPSSPGVGAHQRHLTAGAAGNAIACTECHVVPTSTAHSNGVDDVTFGPLATAAGALAPAWSAAGLSCSSTYCHGSFKNGNATYAPSWTAPAANACGTCHTLPPGGTHPKSTSCGSCHDGYSATSVNPALHLNGAVDVKPLGCTSCHGTPSRLPTPRNPQLAAAPPVDTTGSAGTTSPGVGAHQAHLTAGAMAADLACTECHTVPTDFTHSSGPLDLTWGPTASAAGVTPSFDGTSCANYCHGASLQGGTVPRPTWTEVDGTQAACGACHGHPPMSPPSAAHPRYVLDAPCVGCHASTAALDSNDKDVIVPGGGTHVNASVEASFTGHPAGWVNPADTVCSGGMHSCLPPVPIDNSGDTSVMKAYYDQCTTCHGDGNDFTVSGGPSNVSCAACHVNAFDSHTCTTMGTTPPCSCDLCHGIPDVVIPGPR